MNIRQDRSKFEEIQFFKLNIGCNENNNVIARFVIKSCYLCIAIIIVQLLLRAKNANHTMSKEYCIRYFSDGKIDDSLKKNLTSHNKPFEVPMDSSKKLSRMPSISFLKIK